MSAVLPLPALAKVLGKAPARAAAPTTPAVPATRLETFRKTLGFLTDHLMVLAVLVLFALAAFQQAYETKFGLDDGAWPDMIAPATAPATPGSSQ